MGVLKISVNDIVDYISLTYDYWENAMDTNCYAFALGLDIPEDEIVKNAYQLGVIGATLNDIDLKSLFKMTYEERLALDLNSMQIPFRECDPLEKLKFEQYKIAMFANYSIKNDFHFMRQDPDGIWWQKWGGLISYPINKDNDKKIITNPRTCNIGDYQYIKTYALTNRNLL